MGTTGEDTLKGLQKTLEPYIRPREEVAHIRQILAVHLDSCLKDGAAAGPLALVDTNSIDVAPTARGLQKEYLEALNANIKARKEFAACGRVQRRPSGETASTPEQQGSDRLQEHLAIIRLRQNLEKLQVVERGLNTLEQKPAASPDFLDPGEIFKDSRPLPDVPKDFVTALTIDKASEGPQLKRLIDQLEKHVLQAKLLLRREEQLLEKVKSRSTVRPENVGESVKLEALNRTRVELINWMETELSKAAGDDGDAEGLESQKHRGPAGSINMEEQLASIKEKYAHYLEARRTLLQLVSQQPQPTIKPPTKEEKPEVHLASQPPPTAHLLSPYLEQLLSLAHEQKGLIAHKSHLNTTISRQLKENDQILGHLAEESHLVPAHPMPGASRSKAAFAEATATLESSGPSQRVRPWVFAADSAKISTLEAVAEKIEEGQIALEGSMRTLGELEQLLGKSVDSQKIDEPAGSSEEDLWLTEGQPSSRAAGARRHTIRKADKPAQPKTVWDMLDGNLGLLGSEKDAP
ncbi:hypothetical protein NEMBOFW57_002255 [Staphylotrichum longicolle]|uniref:Uncharacterized protein n=1 Tax=Staphylotrichum longicolle TaxID=669026 RepID=A0AAD4F3Y0_9PEZI|nr:hypothetical protein NEMBOFW57_002255 [Staphylotrichum longicolle]